MVNKFTQKAQKAIAAALSFAEDLGHSYVGSEHLLLGLIAQKESIASRILILRGAKEEKIRQSIIDYMGIGSKSNISAEEMTPRLRRIIESAVSESERARVRYVGTEHLLIALMNRRDCIAVRLLEASGISSSEIRSDLAAYVGNTQSRTKEEPTREEEGKKSKKNSLLAYGKDLTAIAAQGKTDPVLCREKETERLIRILTRRSKNNPCLIGEPGVGKTAVVEGLAERISTGKVPRELHGKRIITLDLSSMIAGAKYRGEFEDRIKNVVDEVQKNPDIILFVDEMHIMIGAGAAEGAIDASNILKPYLARGEIRMIGATTPREYRNHIEKDPAFERRFQPVMLSEPTKSEAKSILLGLKDRYEQHHGIKISDEAIDTAVELSMRYIHDRFLPDKAIDLIDEAAAKIKLLSAEEQTAREQDGKSSLSAEKEAAVKAGDFIRAAELCDEERKVRSATLVLEKVKTESSVTLNSTDIASVISEQTGIPCENLLFSEGQKLLHLEEALSKEIIGQDSAISAIANAIRRGRVGLASPQRPTGSFLFLGGTGVGKTELCKVLAKTMFESKDALIKLDMSEYMEKHSVSKLIGSPPGYVGYGEGGVLTEAVRRRPYSVVLFDEIEKAHPDVSHVLLQILEDGRLSDSSGRIVDFSSTVIIMTSNLISSSELVRKTLGFNDECNEVSKNIRSHKKLREYFRPELLNRIDEIILFSSLSKNDLLTITHLMLAELKERAKRIGFSLEIDANVAELITENCILKNSDSGARGLRRILLETVETPLSEHMIRIAPGEEHRVIIRAEGGRILWN